MKLEPYRQTILITYVTEDQSSAQLLAKNLQFYDLKTWLVEETLQTGKSRQKQPEIDLRQCDSCFVLLSAAYASNRYAYQRLIAIERYLRDSSDFTVFPVVLPETEPEEFTNLPKFIKQYHWSHFKDLIQNDKAMDELINSRVNSSSYLASEQKKTTQTHRTKRTIRLPDIDWVEIPAGDFVNGDLSLQQSIHLDRFFISRYPITNCQYQTFIDADDYDDDRWWLDLKKTEPTPPTWPQDNRPREMVTWYEAIAFTRWLSLQLGFETTLPTSLQWEKAARGTDGREFPWGNSYISGDANVYDSLADKEILEQTSAVGMYPHRASPYQVLDMAGNVWEWSLDDLDFDQSKQQSSGYKMAHGGSWNNVSENARCSFIDYNFSSRQDNIGFRIVCLSPKRGV